MANRIKGITVEINGDTAGLNKSLGDVNKMVRTTQSELQNVEKLLKLDPTNTELLAQKQSLLTKEIGLTSDKLEGLKKASQEAYSKMQSGEISLQQYQALQAEIIRTTEAQQKYTDKLGEMKSASAQLQTTISQQESELSSLKKKYTDVVLEQGKDSDAAKELQSKYDQLNSELTDNKNKMSAAETAASALGKANQSARTPLESLKNTVSTQETAIAKLSDEYQNACLQYGKNSTQAQNLAGKIKLLSSEHQNSKAQLSAMESETKKLTSAEQGLTDKLSSQKQDLSKLKQEYVDATAKYGKHSAEAKSLEQQIKTLSGEISSEENTLQKASEAADKFDQSMKNAGDSAKTAGEKAAASEGKFSKLAGTMGKGVAAGAKAAVKGFEAYTGAAAALGTAVAGTSLKTYTGFESAMSQVQATMGITKDSMSEVDGQTVNTMDALNALAQKMGAETAFSASECAEALNYLALAGYDTQQMTDTLPIVLNLAAAGGIDLASASDMVTDAMSALGMQTEEADTMVDQMAKTASTTNTSVAQLGEGILTIGATAKSIKGGTAELNTALGILANNGIKGAEGGTHLRNVILSLQSPTDKSAAMMEQLGLKTYDSQGNMRSMNDILGDLNKSMEGMSSAEKDNIIGTIFNKTDLAAVNSLLANTGDTWNDLQNSIVNSTGAAQQMADTQLDNISGQLTLLQSAAEGAQVALGEKLAPATKEAVVDITEIINAFNSGGLDAAIPKVNELVTQLAEALKTQIPQILPELMAAFNNIVTTLVQSIGTLLPPLLDTVLPILVTGFLNLITQLLSYLGSALPTILESISSAIMQIIGAITENTPTIISSVMNILQELISFISSNLPLFISAALTLISGFAAGLLDALPDIVDAALQLVQSLCDGLIQNLPEIIQAAVQLVLKLVDGLLQNLPKILNTALQMIQSLIQGLLQCLPDVIQAAIQLVMGLVQGLIQNLPMILQAALQLATGVINSLLNSIPQLITCAMDLVIGLSTGLIQAIPQLIAAIPQLVMALVNGIMQTDWLALGMSILQAIWDGIMSLRSAVSEAWGEIFSNMFDKVAEWASNIWDKAKEAISNFWNAIVETLKKLPGEVWDWLCNVISNVANWVSNMHSKATEAITGFFSNIINKLRNLPGEVGNWLSNVISKVGEFVVNIGNKAREAATNLFNNLVDGLKGLPSTIYSIGSDIVEGLWNGISDMVGWIGNKIKGFGDSVLSGLKDFFGIHSPSRVFKEEIGFNLVYGFVEGVDDKVKKAVNAVNSMGQDVMKAAERSLRMDWNVRGLGNVPKSNSIVNNYYNTDNSRTVNQTNNSPKSLSRLEILRQTKNALKGVVV